jgi:hypothetical protein
MNAPKGIPPPSTFPVIKYQAQYHIVQMPKCTGPASLDSSHQSVPVSSHCFMPASMQWMHDAFLPALFLQHMVDSVICSSWSGHI